MKRIIPAGFAAVFLLAASFFAFAEGAPERGFFCLDKEKGLW